VSGLDYFLGHLLADARDYHDERDRQFKAAVQIGLHVYFRNDFNVLVHDLVTSIASRIEDCIRERRRIAAREQLLWISGTACPTQALWKRDRKIEHPIIAANRAVATADGRNTGRINWAQGLPTQASIQALAASIGLEPPANT